MGARGLQPPLKYRYANITHAPVSWDCRDLAKNITLSAVCANLFITFLYLKNLRL